MEVSYCTQWSKHRKCAREPLTEAQAREAHRVGGGYMALIGPEDRPTCRLELSRHGSIWIEFLDPFLRGYMYYSFQTTESARSNLFLAQACILEFFELSDIAIRGPACFFRPDGELLVDHIEYNPATRVERIVSREEFHVDVSDNWEPYPEFGHYEGLSRIRNIPQLKL